MAQGFYEQRSALRAKEALWKTLAFELARFLCLQVCGSYASALGSLATTKPISACNTFVPVPKLGRLGVSDNTLRQAASLARRARVPASMALKKKITHCIFDMDGLLLNTEAFYTVVQQKILQEYGHEFTWELKSNDPRAAPLKGLKGLDASVSKPRVMMMGKKALEAAEWLVDTLKLQNRMTPQEFLIKREAALDQLFPTAELMPGAERLLRHLKEHRIPFCLATSSHQRHFDLKTAQHTELFSLFDLKITGDQVSKGKPAPDIFLKAAQSFHPPAEPAACLVFEDAPSGVAAAKNAGMWTVMVPDEQLDRNLTQEADSVISTLEDFDLAAWGLPPLHKT